MFHIIITYILSVTLLLFCGYGLSVYLMPDYLRKYNLLIMPAVGFSVINTISHLFSWFGWGSKDFAWLVLLIALVINLFSYIKNKKKIHISIKENYFPVICSIILFGVSISPLTQIRDQSPVIGTSGDAVVYSALADYVQEKGLQLSNHDKSKPVQEWAYISISTGFQFGFSFFHSLVNKILNAPAYKTISIISALFISYYCMAIYFLTVSLFTQNKAICRLVTILSLFNPMIMGIHLSNYSRQTIGFSLLIILIALSVNALKSKKNNLLILSALIFSSLSSTYFAIVPYYVAPMLMYSGISFIRKELNLKAFIKLLISFICLSFILNPVGFFFAAKRVSILHDVIVKTTMGNVHEFIPFYEIYGLYHHIAKSLLLSHLNPLILSIIILVSIFGVFRVAQDKRDILLSVLLPYVLIAIIVKYYYQYPYGYFKSLSISHFILLIIFGLGIGEIIKLRRFKGVTISFVIILCFFNIFNQIKLLNIFKTKFIKIYSIERFCKKVSSLVPVDKPIYIANEIHAKMLWMLYFLKERPAFINHFSLYFTDMYDSALNDNFATFYKHHIDDEYIILNNNATKNISYMSIGETLEENEEYKLFKTNPNIVFYKDSYFNLNNLVSENQMNINFDNNKIKINDEIFPLKGSDSDLYEMSFGFYVPIGGKLEIENKGRSEILKNNNSGVKIIDLSTMPVDISLKNIGKGEIFLRFIKLEGKNHKNKKRNSAPSQNLFDLYKDKITPESNAYAVGGWYLLEKDKRWSKSKSLSLAKNPFRESELLIEGTLPLGNYAKKPTIEISLNSHLLDRFTATNDLFKKKYVVSEDILGKPNWSEIEIKINPTFTPDDINHSGDKRHLGIMFQKIELR